MLWANIKDLETSNCTNKILFHSKTSMSISAIDYSYNPRTAASTSASASAERKEPDSLRVDELARWDGSKDLDEGGNRDTELNFKRTIGIGSRRIAGITSDEVLTCIRNLGTMLHVDPSLYQEMVRLAELRVHVINRFARQVHPEWPMVLEWIMLLQMQHSKFKPIRCLSENPNKSAGEPIYKASCFRPGIYLPGSNGFLYLSVSLNNAAADPTSSFWQKVDTSLYGEAGLTMGNETMKRIQTAMDESNEVTNYLWQNIGDFGEALLARRGEEHESWKRFGQPGPSRKSSRKPSIEDEQKHEAVPVKEEEP